MPGTPKSDSMVTLVVKALVAIRSSKKGTSRQAVANWIFANTDKTPSAAFNGWLRRAFATGMGKNLFVQGETKQRYKLGEAAKNYGKPKKKVVKKKKAAGSKKKKTTKKKKKTTAKKSTKKKTTKKKTVTKKKSVKKVGKKSSAKKSSSSKKKTTSNKKKTTSKK